LRICAKAAAWRLQVINSSSMSAYHLDLGRLNGELTAVDGFRIQPVAERRFLIAVAQRLDIRIALPREPAAYTVWAILEGERSQTGSILKAGNPLAKASFSAGRQVSEPPISHSPCELDIRLMGFIIAPLGETSQGRNTCLRSIVA
jgi:hypothetical protein